MTRPAFLVFVSVRALAAAATLLALTLALISCGDAQEEIAPVSRSPTATSSPSSLSAPPTASPVASVEPGGRAPDGCTSSERAYMDPDNRFAVCYRSDMEIITTKDQTASGTSVTVRYPLTDPNGVSVTIGWEETPAYTPCEETMHVVKNRHMEDLVVSGTTVKACVQDLYEISDPNRYLATSIDFAVPRNGAPPILVSAGYAGQSITRSGLDARAVTTRILNSLKVF